MTETEDAENPYLHESESYNLKTKNFEVSVEEVKEGVLAREQSLLAEESKKLPVGGKDDLTISTPMQSKKTQSHSRSGY